MEKQIYGLASGLLKLNRWWLLLLIGGPISISLYAKGSGSIETTNQIIVNFSGAVLLLWLFAIKHKANDKLIENGIKIQILQYFNILIIFNIVFYVLSFFATKTIDSSYNNIQIHYVTPIIIPIVFCISFFGTLFLVSKSLLSAELNKEATFNEYVSTLLLLIFTPIGIWFIQPRVQQL